MTGRVHVRMLFTLSVHCVTLKVCCINIHTTQNDNNSTLRFNKNPLVFAKISSISDITVHSLPIET